jgi:hypothetical protein
MNGAGSRRPARAQRCARRRRRGDRSGHPGGRAPRVDIASRRCRVCLCRHRSRPIGRTCTEQLGATRCAGTSGHRTPVLGTAIASGGMACLYGAFTTGPRTNDQCRRCGRACNFSEFDFSDYPRRTDERGGNGSVPHCNGRKSWPGVATTGSRPVAPPWQQINATVKHLCPAYQLWTGSLS